MPEFKQKISVIIPAYNIKNLIERCVESVAKQDYPKELLEIILVDDGSTDGTAELCDALSDRHENVTVFHKPNGGSSSARNLGISKATGDYIGFVDSDDYVDKRMYSSLMSAALEYGADMVQISRDEIAEDGTRLPNVVTPPSGTIVISPRDHMRDLLMHVGDSSFCTKLIKKDLFKGNMKFPEGELNEDFYLMIHMLREVNKIVVLPQQYYHVFYRIGSNSRKRAEDKDYFPRVFTDIVRNADVALRIVKKSYPELIPVAERFGYYQRLDYLLHIPISKMTNDNVFYMSVVRKIRYSLKKILKNKYLTKKQKLYLLILAPAPRFVRKAHAFVRHI